MIYRTLHIVIIILLWINLMPSYSQPEEGPESFVQNISLPGGLITDGINPEDIIFADNKYFVAGLGTVLVLNEEFTVINTINLSERGQYGYEASTILAENPTHCLMAFNGSNKLFVISPDNEICIISTAGIGSLESQRIPKPTNVPSILFMNSIIRYDPVNDRLFWLITWDINQIYYSYLGCYCASYPYGSLWPETIFTNNQIKDIAVSNVKTIDEHSYFYLARQSSIDVAKSDVLLYQSVKSITSIGERKRLLYIHTNNLHRIYCISSTEITWIDGDNYNINNKLSAPFNALNCLAYNPSSDELCLGGYLNVYIYNGSNPQEYISILMSEGNNDGPIYRLECFGNVFYASLPSKLEKINPDHTVELLLTKQNNFFGAGASNPDPNSGSVVITNMEGASLETFDSQGVHANLLTGISSYKSCYNPNYQKFYFYSNELRDDSKVAIIKHNMLNNAYSLDGVLSYDFFGAEKNISSCGYNEATNHLLISSYFPTNRISKRNGSDNTDAGYLNLSHGYCENIFITPQPNSKIFCSTAMNSLSDASIEIYNANDYSYVTTLDGFGTGYEGHDFKTYYCYNTIDNDVYFILYPRSNNITYSKIVRIDLDNGCTMDPPYILDAIPEKIIYCESCNTICIKYLSEDYFTIFNCNNLSSPLNDYFLYHTIKDIEYSSYFNRLYVLAIGVNHLNAVYSGSCFGFEEPIPRWEAPAYCNAIKYNNLNQRLYVYSPFEWDVDFESHLSILDHNEEEIDDIFLHNSQCVRYANPDLYNNLVVDPVTGYLLVPNGSHSNISVIRCPERLELTNRINWISFPRLDRNPDDNEAIDSKVALENRIIPGPDNTFSGQMKYLAYDPGYPQTGVMTSIDKQYPGSSWNQTPGLLYEVYSNRGYQLQVTPDQQFIYFYGHIQEPDVPVELEGTQVDRFTNWVGYYLTYPQSPFDAIPENVLENLTMISGQYWSCARYNPSPIESGYDCWRCAVNQGRIEINYGDMVKLTSSASTSFTWLQNNPDEPSVEKLKAESFVYNEQYNYEALFIELDSNDIPEEIGAFAGDSCVGATKVLPGDTTVLICAYTEGYEGEDITFEFSYTTKAARIDQKDYYVLNPGTGKSERRRIKAGENQPCHFVSFKQTNDDQSNTSSNGLNCYPNPAGDAFSLSYYIPEDGYVKLEILNSLGLIVLEKPFGNQTQGNHSCDVQTAGLPAGYYFVRLYTGKQIIAGTLLINR